jgi:hypothetical protein
MAKARLGEASRRVPEQSKGTEVRNTVDLRLA